MKIENIKISDIKPYSKNNKKHSEKQIELVANSIKDFGFNTPVILDEKNVIIAGHCRVEASKKLGLTEIPCIKKSDLTAEQIKAYRIADNKLTEIGDWDFENIDLEISELLDLDFDIERYGLDDFDLNCLNPEVVEDDYIEPEVVKTNIKIGDIIELGNHRLLCGDSTLESSYIDLMQGKKADMVFTDPPYNINFKPQRGTHDIILNDNMSDDNFQEFLNNVFLRIKENLKQDSYLITFMGWSTIHSFYSSIKTLFEIKSMPIWVKNNFGIGYYTRPKYEPFYLCLNGKPTKPKEPPADIFESEKVSKTIHSCEKPIKLISTLLKTFDSGNLILDPFLGSGSTLIACEQLDRICYGIELEPKYCQVIIDRYKKFRTENKKPFSIKINGKDYK